MVSYSIALDLDLDPRTDAEIAADRIGPVILAAVVGPPLPQPPRSALRLPETAQKRARGLTVKQWEDEVKANFTPAEWKAWDMGNRPDYVTPEWLAQRSASYKVLWTDPVLRAKLSVAMKTAMADPVTQAKVSAAVTARWTDPACRAKLSAAIKVAMAKPAYKAKQSAATRERWVAWKANQSPEELANWKAKLSAVNLGKKRSLETRAKLSAAHQGQEVSPETRAKYSVAWTPERRAAQAERMRTDWNPRKAETA